MRASFFPAALPDELTYSVCCAFHLLSGHASAVLTRALLFGSVTGVPDLAMAGSQLGRLVGHVRDATTEAVHAWLWKHTMYPLWGVFADVSARTAWLKKVMTGSGRGFAQVTGDANVSRFSRYLVFCPECICLDTAAYGRPYWHRSHQVLGVTHCHAHRLPLLQACPRCHYRFDRRPAFALPSPICRECGAYVADDAERIASGSPLHEYGNIVHRVLASTGELVASGLLPQLRDYRHRADEVIARLREAFGPQHVLIADLPARGSAKGTWVAHCLRGYRTDTPVRLFLLATALHLQALDKQASEPVIKPCAATNSVSAADLAKFRAVATLGVVRALLRGATTEAVAMQYGLSHAKVAWLVARWEALRMRRKALAAARRRIAPSNAPTPTRTRSHEAIVQAKRGRLLDLIKKYDATKRTEIDAHDASLVHWLRTNDSAWLDDTLPVRRRALDPAVWALRDDHLVSHLHSAEFQSRASLRGSDTPWSFPVQTFGNHFRRDLAKGRFPKTAAALAAMGFTSHKEETAVNSKQFPLDRQGDFASAFRLTSHPARCDSVVE